jgi:hypothetical protein
MFNDPRVGTSAAGGLAGAVVLLIAHTFTYFTGVEMTPDFQTALAVVGVAIGGMFVHRISEDSAALHKLILAKLGEKAGPPLVGGTVAGIRPSPMGDVRP